MLQLEFGRIHRQPSRGGPHGALEFVRPIADAFGQAVASLAIQHSLRHVAHPVELRPAAGEHDALIQIPLHAGTLDFPEHIEEQLFRPRFQDFDQFATAGLARLAALGRWNLDQAGVGGQPQQRAAILLLQTLRIFRCDLKYRGDVAREMIAVHRKTGCELNRFAVVNHQAARVHPQIHQRHPPGAILRIEARVRSGQWFENGFFHRQMREVCRSDQSLMLLHGRRNDVHVGLEAGTYALVRPAEPGAAVQREVLRQHVKQHAVRLQTHMGGALGRIAQILLAHLARPAEFVKPAALRAVNVRSSDTKRRSVDGYLGAALRVVHRLTDRFGRGILIDDAAFIPSGRTRQPVSQVAKMVSLQRANHAARA